VLSSAGDGGRTVLPQAKKHCRNAEARETALRQRRKQGSETLSCYNAQLVFHARTGSVTVNNQVLVGIIMGSQSDWETMKNAAETLDSLGIPYETQVVSAHRTPDRMFEYAEAAADRGLRVIIAGAGGAAHLPGMVAAKTVVPVLGVPIQSKALNGMDSLLSIAQMPAGIPVGTLAIGAAGATNAALLAAAIIGTTEPVVRAALEAFRRSRTDAVLSNPDPSQA
jgi:5-(carboxyamino)imidazole ribonucleotide mutase